MIRLVIVDDHALVRSGLRLLINAQLDMNVIGEAGDAFTALAEIQALNPDVATVDLTLPGRSGVQAIQRIRAECPRTCLLALSMHDEAAYVRAVLAAGGMGYVLKSSADVQLISAIRAVARGQIFVDPHLMDKQCPLVDAATIGSSGSPQLPTPSLTKREREVLGLLALGYTNQEVADRLHRSVKTVETLRSRTMRKLGLRTRADLVRFALETGVLSSSTNAQLP